MNPTSPRIVVLGSINADLIIRCGKLPLPGETVLADSSSELPGGKGANQAVAAARLGGRVTMIGRVGDDVFGDRLLSSLAAENVDCSLVRRTADCASGMAVVAVERSGENSILVLPGANGRLTEEDVSLATEAICASDLLVLQLEIPLHAVLVALAVARANGIRTVLNPAPAQSLPPKMLNVDVLCPNLAEASVLVGYPIQSRVEAQDAVSNLCRLGPRAVVITMGSQGAVLGEGEQVTWFDPFPVEAVDTTAAGDAFAGALAVSLGEGVSLCEAVRFACAAGAIAATRHGAQPALPWRSEVEALLRTKN